MIIDTTFIIDFLRGEKEAIAKISELKNEPIKTTSVSVFEVWQGIHDIRDKSRRERIENFLSSIGLLAFDVKSAKTAGTIYAELKTKGKSIDAADCMIGGIALNQNEVLLTRNKKHFENIPGLKIDVY